MLSKPANHSVGRYRTLLANRRGLCVVLLLATVQLLACSRSMPGNDVSLSVNETTLGRLRTLRAEPKFVDLPGAPAAAERRRLEPLINDLIDRLIVGLPAHPTKRWLLETTEPTVSRFYLEDTEARDRCVDYLDRIFQIVGTKGADGAFAKYMIDL